MPPLIAKTASFLSWLSAMMTAAAHAQTLTTLFNFHSFASATGLTQSTSGNLYGAVIGGGGTIFKVTPAGTVTPVYVFCNDTGCPNGRSPSSGLVQASNGDLYGGTTSLTALGSSLGGTIFKLTPAGALTTLYTFEHTGKIFPEGKYPLAALMQSASGDLYGTAYQGGDRNDGTVFKITPGGAFTTLHIFDGADGSGPTGVLWQTGNGEIYGTTTSGGLYGGGTVFEIGGIASLTTLYQFCAVAGCPDGAGPSGVTQAGSGDFFGTTFMGGTHGGGTIFRMTSSGALTTLYNFCNESGCPGGWGPSSLVQGADGNLYGSTSWGGSFNGGTIFKISLSGTFTALYNFCSQSDCADGAGPSDIVQGMDGKFYGTTSKGGTSGYGTIFSLSVD
jgi:uncharacterized repeat protein (TIGR03803 family)